MEPTGTTWLLAGFGAITFLPLWVVQFGMIFRPHSRQVLDLLIGKGDGWRDETHFRSALAFAWADLLVLCPLAVLGTIGVFNGQLWGYVVWISLGFLSIYFSILMWVLEKEYTCKSKGWIAYFTYYWGFFLYWGIGAIIHSFLQIGA